MGGVVRYYEEYKGKLEIKPAHVVILAVIIIIIELILLAYESAILGF